ncbi:hypothetical protein EXS71_01810 [Candidatus Uhrbacteria bacterium]|nr:hypothetical protein [Candidatus Uhrbacteria bacterium]
MGKMIGMMVPKDRIRSTAQIDPSWLNGLVLVDEVVRMPGSSQEGTVSVMFVFFSREQGRKILDEHRSSLHSAVLCSHRAKLEDSPLLETSSLQLLRWTGYAAAALRERIQAGGEDGGSFSIETTDDKPHVVQLGMMSPSKDPYPQEHVNGFILLFDEQGCHLSILYSKEQARTLVSRYARSLIPKNVRDYQDVIARSGLPRTSSLEMIYVPGYTPGYIIWVLQSLAKRQAGN